MVGDRAGGFSPWVPLRVLLVGASCESSCGHGGGHLADNIGKQLVDQRLLPNDDSFTIGLGWARGIERVHESMKDLLPEWAMPNHPPLSAQLPASSASVDGREVDKGVDDGSKRVSIQYAAVTSRVVLVASTRNTQNDSLPNRLHIRFVFPPRGNTRESKTPAPQHCYPVSFSHRGDSYFAALSSVYPSLSLSLYLQSQCTESCSLWLPPCKWSRCDW